MRTDKRAELCKEFFDALLPALRYGAKCCGYAIAVHGSQINDLDLICVPWTEWAIDAEDLIAKLEKIVKSVIADQEYTSLKDPVKKPHGRLGYAIHLTPEYGDGPYLDISITPKKVRAVESNPT